MNRKSNSNYGQKNNPRRGAPGKGGPGRGGFARSGPGKSGQGQPAQRSVSPMYKVDLMHHQLSGMTSQPPQHTGRPPVRHQQPRPHGSNKPSHLPKDKKGYTSLTVDLKDDLYKQFVSKVKEQDKSPKEVMNQLISFYNMGKINI